ncbi:MAG: AAA-like domain-containing protein [Anaerolineae bacterium]|nr:AAA-like domain-containing protein [Anaerolineae bacterium]
MTESIYVTGGTVQAGGGIYISRPADEELLRHCLAGDFCYVFTARQMGKSSLMVHTAQQLADKQVCAARIDLTDIGTNVSSDQWYLGMIYTIVNQLGLDVDYAAWWEKYEHLGETQRFGLFLRQIVLQTIDKPIVIFIDEIDTTLSLKFSADDFFATIRAIYNARATDAVCKRLTFVLLGVAHPTALMQDSKRTPFNIGVKIDLTDFTLSEAKLLASGLKIPPDEVERAMRWILYWTNGHPYLTQQLCQTLAQRPEESLKEGQIAETVEKLFLGLEIRDFNLQFVRDMLTKKDDPLPVLKRYYVIRATNVPIPDDERDPLNIHLKLSGVVRAKDNLLVVRNIIYERLFDGKWAIEMIEAVGRERRIDVSSFMTDVVGDYGVPGEHKERLQTVETDYIGDTTAPKEAVVKPVSPLPRVQRRLMDATDELAQRWEDIREQIRDHLESLADSAGRFLPGKRGGVEKRLERYANIEAASPTGAKPARERPSPPVEQLDKTVAGRGFATDIAIQLARADLKISAGEYMALALIAAMAGAMLGYLISAHSPILMLIGAAVGFLIPRVYVGIVQYFRLNKFSNQLADCLDTIANGLHAGYSFLQAMEATAREFPPPISVELGRVVKEVQLGFTVEDSLSNMLRRVPLEDLDTFVTTINIQREVGGNPGEIMREVVNNPIRERIRVADKTGLVKPVFAVFFMMIAIVTAIQWTVSTAYFSSAWGTTAGRGALLIAYGLLSIGTVTSAILEQSLRKTLLELGPYRRILFDGQSVLDLLLGGVALVVVVSLSAPSAVLAWMGAMLIYRVIGGTWLDRLGSSLVSLLLAFGFQLIKLGLLLSVLAGAVIGVKYIVQTTLEVSNYAIGFFVWCIALLVLSNLKPRRVRLAGLILLLLALPALAWGLRYMNPTVLFVPGYWIIVLLVFSIACLIAIGVRSPDLADTLQTRLEKHAAREQPATLEEIELSLSFRQRLVAPVVRCLAQAIMQVSPQQILENMRHRLELAGNPYTVAGFVASQVIMVVLGAAMGFVLAGLAKGPLLIQWAGALAGVELGHVFSEWSLIRRAAKRKELIAKVLPNALNFLVICMDAGLGFDSAMGKLTEKWDNVSSLEFGRVLHEIRLGKLRREALRDMAARIEIPDVTSFVAAMIQADQLGVSISRVLLTQSDRMHMRRLQQIQDRAERLDFLQTMCVNVLLGPSIMLWLIAPVIAQVIK